MIITSNDTECMRCFNTFNINDDIQSDPRRWKPNDYNMEDCTSQSSLYAAVWRVLIFQRINSVGAFSLDVLHGGGGRSWRTPFPPYPSYPLEFLL